MVRNWPTFKFTLQGACSWCTHVYKICHHGMPLCCSAEFEFDPENYHCCSGSEGKLGAPLPLLQLTYGLPGVGQLLLGLCYGRHYVPLDCLHVHLAQQGPACTHYTGMH